MFAKLSDKQFVQNIVIEVVADSIMLVCGLVVGYYIRTLLF
ncbi:hypothetical protein AB4Z22_03390 [Paenibacillus sp. TAF58]